jgi:hypothetical protein
MMKVEPQLSIIVAGKYSNVRVKAMKSQPKMEALAGHVL